MNDEPALKIVTLGRFAIYKNGKPLTSLGSRKAEALLVYLAWANQPVSRDSLIALFWPDHTQNKALASLSTAVSALRRHLPDCIVATRQTVSLNHEIDYWLDAAVLQTKLQHWREEAGQEATIELGEVLDLYQGEFLAGFHVRDSYGFEEWALLTGENLRSDVTQALLELAQYYLVTGRYEHGIEQARRLIYMDPIHEGAHRLLMQLLARSGERNAALVQYETCRQTLEDELGVEPAWETTAWYERIRAASRGPHQNLPPPPNRLIGREEEYALAHKQLMNADCRLLTILGPGGIGKSRLAIEVGRKLVNSFLNGVFFVELVGVETADSLVPTIAQFLDLTFQDEETSAAQLVQFLKGKEILLILDNYEQLLPDVQLLHDLLHQAPDVKLLVSSRQRLGMVEEWTLELQGLPYLETETAVATINIGSEPFPAVQLFLTSGQRVRPDFLLRHDNVPYVNQICQLVQGIPLGIELAAAWVRVLSCREIAAQIKENLGFLDGSISNLPVRHRSMQAVFDHSWDLLTAVEQAVFCRLSVFRGGFSWKAAQDVTGASLSLLASLVDKSLLRPSQSDKRERGRRFVLHELIRQFAGARLNQNTKEKEETQGRHSLFFTRFMARKERELRGARQKLALAEIEADIENVRAAWRWAVAHDQFDQLAQAADGLGYFYQWRARFQDGEADMHLAAQKLAGGKDAGKQLSLARIWCWESIFSYILGKREQADQLLEKCDNILGDPILTEQDTRSNRAFVLLQKGRRELQFRYKEAHTFFEQALALYQELDDSWGIAYALDGLGNAVFGLGQYDKSGNLYRRSLALRKSFGESRELANLLGLLASTATYQGEIEEAERLAREATTLYQDIGDRASLANGYRRLGVTLFYAAKWPEARPFLEECVAIYRDLGDRRKLPRALVTLGTSLANSNKFEESRVQFQKALTLAQEVGDQSVMAWALWQLGSLALIDDAYQEAQQFNRKSVAIHRERGDLGELSYTLAHLGYAEWGLGNLEKAREYVTEALQTAVEIRMYYSVLAALNGVALILADQGDKERALEIHTLTSRYPVTGKSPVSRRTVGRHLETVASSLPPETAKAAMNRGQALDLWETATEISENLESFVLVF
jgi:predicted ATPase/DNA-binding SARP family transcriptional activator